MIRVFGYYVPRRNLVLGLVHFALFWGAFVLGVLMRFGWTVYNDFPYAEVAVSGAIFAAVMSLSLLSMGLYRRGPHDPDEGFAVRLAFAFAIGTALVALVLFLFPSVTIGRGVLALSILFSFIALMTLRRILAHTSSGFATKRRVLVLGAGVNARHIAEVVETHPGIGFFFLGYVPLPGDQRGVQARKLLPPRGSLLELAIAKKVDEIVIAADNGDRDLPVGELLDCKLSGFPVFDLATFVEKEFSLIRIDLIRPSWLFASQDGFRTGVTGLYGKRLFDLLISSAMLILAAPVMVLVMIASLIASKGREPVFYHQVRIGVGGRPFRMHKFRTMRADAEADGKPRWARIDDPRITRLGVIMRRSRLDELPQLFNVLKGQMSLVGPRPERPEFVEQLSRVIPCYAQRHRVKPGLTGWAQLLYSYGSNEEDAQRKLEYDLYYVKHASIMFDFVILVQTVEVVLLGNGAR